jgi:hypothetical protein
MVIDSGWYYLVSKSDSCHKVIRSVEATQEYGLVLTFKYRGTRGFKYTEAGRGPSEPVFMKMNQSHFIWSIRNSEIILTKNDRHFIYLH